ncbi:MAG: ABC transporter substrate-binding protein [Kiloniellaceae bacterium]
MTARFKAALFLVALVAAPAGLAPIAVFAAALEAPAVAARVAAGELPPLAERLPDPPAVAALDPAEQTLGEYGGALKLLMGRQKDIRMMMVYGYARLVGYDRKLRLEPDIVERVDIDEDRVFTFHLRQGHRWSDGQPFTAEDFRYYWDDVANNEELSPFGPPKVLIVDGEVPRFEVLDPLTVRYSWSRPNPYFLPALAGARPLFIYRPAHYLRQFHVRYAPAEELAAKVAAASKRNWAGLHHQKDQQYRLNNVDLPTLQPWMNTTAPPAERFVFERNPYYHRVDSKGQQLPYIDRVIVNIAEKSLIPAKTGFGESDLQARYIRFDHYTFLKKGESEQGFAVRLWPTASGSKVALFPNLTAQDPVWRTLMRDVRFRRALSVAIDRQTINQVLYFGLARPSADTVLPEGPLFDPAYQSAWAQYDVAKANALLDEIGLSQRDSAGTRLLPDGRPLQIIIDSAGESTEESDVLELIKKDWAKVGIELFTKPSQREVFRNRVFAGQAIMSVWSGLENGLPTPDMSPMELAPTAQIQLEWSKWGEHYETSQSSGQAPDLPVAQELLKLNTAWRFAETKEERAEIWKKMLAIRADQVFSIGTVNGVPQPIVVSNQLRNVPSKGIFNWDPGAYFGIYKPDTYWFTAARRTAAD